MVKIPTESLVRDLRGLAIWLGKQPTLKEYNEYGKYATGTIKNRFGSWTDGREAAGITEENGFRKNRTYWHTEGELREELHRLEKEHGTVTTDIMKKHSDKFSVKVYQKRYGSWNEALIENGCTPYERGDVPAEDLIDALRGLGQMFGRRPKSSEFIERTRYNTKIIYEHFESYNDLLDQAGFLPPEFTTECDYCGDEITVKRVKFEKHDHSFCDRHCHGKFLAESRNCEIGGSINYGPLFDENREKALKRDQYRCQGCGMTDQKHREEYGRSLTMHHISRKHWPDDPEEHHRLENLVTLCNSCHPYWEGIPVRPQLVDVYG